MVSTSPSGNPTFVRGDWYGTGKRTVLWFRFELEPDGAATLFFKGEVYHMFDFDHTGAKQVMTLDGGTMRADAALAEVGLVRHIARGICVRRCERKAEVKASRGGTKGSRLLLTVDILSNLLIVKRSHQGRPQLLRRTQ